MANVLLAEAAKAAINWFNDTEFMGAKIKVEIAQRKVRKKNHFKMKAHALGGC